MNPSINEDKYIEALEFLLDESVGANNELLGKVKLMKLLYFADFDHFFKHGASITGDSYARLDFGPVPQQADRILAKLKQQLECLDYEKTPFANGFKYQYRLSKKWTSPHALTDAELDTLREVVGTWRDKTTSEIVAASHADPPWRMVKGYGELIPYHLVYYRRHVAPLDDEEPVTAPARA